MPPRALNLRPYIGPWLLVLVLKGGGGSAGGVPLSPQISGAGGGGGQAG